ncbi:Pectate lyase superfamily protein [Planctomycetes bacterium MalM25]|nr:Pectate lyase superfamily protein [Planctomycetes bacterium MalM25]
MAADCQVEAPLLDGDYDRDGVVSAADYTIYRDTLGQSVAARFEAADGDGDGVVDPEDHAVWAANYGARFTSSGSDLFDRYVAALNHDTALPLPNFAYAGYQRSEAPLPDPGWQVFRVGDFGAFPNDGLDDRAAVQNTIDAASNAANGAIVLFDAGRYLLSETTGLTDSVLDIGADNLILRGAGSQTGGTELYFREHLNSTTPEKFWSTPAMINARGGGGSVNGTLISTVSADARMGEHRIQVASAGSLSVGDVVAIRLDDPAAANDDLIAPYSVEDAWTTFRSGEITSELHRIAAINGNQLTFAEPLATDLDSQYRWEVRRLDAGRQLGFEDMTLRGGWTGDFVHHRSIIDDSGWTALRIVKYVDSWVENVRMVDWNQGLTLAVGMNTTVKDTVVEGTAGHSGISVQNTYGALLTNVHDRTDGGMWHPMGVSHRAAATVFHRVSWPSNRAFDAHGVFPHATLFDDSTGGLVGAASGSGGAQNNLPNHMRDLVMWNFNHTGQDGLYDWWRTSSRFYRILPPILVGWHGQSAQFLSGQVEYVESFGAAVQPASLFEAQLNVRFGATSASQTAARFEASPGIAEPWEPTTIAQPATRFSSSTPNDRPTETGGCGCGGVGCSACLAVAPATTVPSYELLAFEAAAPQPQRIDRQRGAQPISSKNLDGAQPGLSTELLGLPSPSIHEDDNQDAFVNALLADEVFGQAEPVDFDPDEESTLAAWAR